jgi:hypothetical protein
VGKTMFEFKDLFCQKCQKNRGDTTWDEVYWKAKHIEHIELVAARLHFCALSTVAMNVRFRAGSTHTHIAAASQHTHIYVRATVTPF